MTPPRTSGISVPSTAAWAAAIAAVLLGCISVSVRQVADWDVWWQLRIAHDAIATRSVLANETFSYSFEGAPWPHKDLVGYLVLYAGWSLAGYAGMATVLAATMALGCAAWFVILPRAARQPLIFSAISLLWLAAMQGRVMPRAQVFSITLFVVMAALIELLRRLLTTARPIGGVLVAVVAVQAAWMNLHRGGIHGLVLLTGFAIFALGSHALRSTRAGPAVSDLPPLSVPRLAAIGALPLVAAAAGALNPSGFAVYTTGFRVSTDPIHRGLITEWLPLSLESARSLYPVASLVLAAGVAAATWVVVARLAGRRGVGADAWHVGVAAVFARQGLSSARWMTDGASAALLPLVLVLAHRHPPGDPRARARLASPIAVVAVAGALLLLGHATNPSQPGLGAQRDRYPVDAIAFAAQAGLGPRVHNAFVYGGPLTWFGRDHFRTLVDGRNDMVFPSAFYARCVEAQRDPEVFAALVAEHAPDWVLADNTPGRESFAFLADDPRWALVHWSEPATVWVPRETADRLGLVPYRFLRPGAETQALAAAIAGAAPDSAVPAQIVAELDRANAEAGGGPLRPASFRIGALHVLLHHSLGAPSRHTRDAWLLAVADRWPDHPALPALLALVNGTPRD